MKSKKEKPSLFLLVDTIIKGKQDTAHLRTMVEHCCKLGLISREKAIEVYKASYQYESVLGKAIGKGICVGI